MVRGQGGGAGRAAGPGEGRGRRGEAERFSRRGHPGPGRVGWAAALVKKAAKKGAAAGLHRGRSAVAGWCRSEATPCESRLGDGLTKYGSGSKCSTVSECFGTVAS